MTWQQNYRPNHCKSCSKPRKPRKDLLKQFSFKKGSWYTGYEVKANGYFEGLDFWMVRFEKTGRRLGSLPNI